MQNERFRPEQTQIKEPVDLESIESPVTTFLQAAVYSAAERPARGLAQIVDSVGGTQCDRAVENGFAGLGIKRPEPAAFATPTWFSQQLGSAVGTVVPYFVLRQTVESGASKLFGEETIMSKPLDVGLSQSLPAYAMKESALSATTGFLYGSLLSPTNSQNLRQTGFVVDRLVSGATSSAVFGAIGLANPYVSDYFATLSTSVNGMPLNSGLKTALSTALTGPVMPGMVAGLPAGVLGAEFGAWQQGRRYASIQQLKESMLATSFVGAALSGSSWLSRRGQATPEFGPLATPLKWSQPDQPNLEEMNAQSA